MNTNIKWNENTIYEFLRFEHNPEHKLWPDRNAKIINAGLVQENENRDWVLTQKGKEELENIRQHFNSGNLSELPLCFRNYYFDWGEYDDKNLPVENLAKVALRDRSAEVRKKAVELLDKYDKLDTETSNSLAYNEDYQIRLKASKHADLHNFFDETDERVVETIIQNRRPDRECVEHWLDSSNGQIRVQAALLTDDNESDEVLARLEPQDVALVLARSPQWATGGRVMDAWKNADEIGRYRLVKVMWDVPDSFIEQVLKDDSYSALRDRLEEYRKAVDKMLELDSIFSGGSEIRRKIWERAIRQRG